MLALLTLLCTTASAAGFYHPDDIAAESALFARAQREAGTVYGEREERSMALAAALRSYEEALDLLGPDAPAAERARLDALDRVFRREVSVLQRFTSESLDGFESAFVSAMQRAIGGQALVECHASQTARGPRMTPRFGGAGPEPVQCEGEDANQRLARAMDADPVLKAELDQILTRPWPELTLDVVPQAPVAASAAAVVPVLPFFRTGAREALAEITSADEDARLDFQAAIEDGASPEKLASFRAEADRITATTAAQRAAVAAIVRAPVEKLWAKLAKKGQALGWCAQPELLGGCTAPVASAELITSVQTHPTVSRAFDKARAWRP